MEPLEAIEFAEGGGSRRSAPDAQEKRYYLIELYKNRISMTFRGHG